MINDVFAIDFAYIMEHPLLKPFQHSFASPFREMHLVFVVVRLVAQLVLVFGFRELRFDLEVE